MAVKMRPSYCRTKRPRGALLQLGIELSLLTVENRREPSGDSEIPLFDELKSNPFRLESSEGTVSGGQFDWGGRSGKSNRSVQRSA